MFSITGLFQEKKELIIQNFEKLHLRLVWKELSLSLNGFIHELKGRYKKLFGIVAGDFLSPQQTNVSCNKNLRLFLFISFIEEISTMEVKRSYHTYNRKSISGISLISIVFYMISFKKNFMSKLTLVSLLLHCDDINSVSFVFSGKVNSKSLILIHLKRKA